MKFDRFRKTDLIVVTDNMNRDLRTINNRATIVEVARFTLSHKSDWKTPWAGTPIALIRANFYVGGKFIGDLGVGSNFRTAQGCDDFRSRSVSAKDRETIMNLLAVKDPYTGN